jgi:hypothetical protein
LFLPFVVVIVILVVLYCFFLALGVSVFQKQFAEIENYAISKAGTPVKLPVGDKVCHLIAA